MDYENEFVKIYEIDYRNTVTKSVQTVEFEALDETSALIEFVKWNGEATRLTTDALQEMPTFQQAVILHNLVSRTSEILKVCACKRTVLYTSKI